MEFVNTNSHRIYLKRDPADAEANVKVAPGASFEADGYLADVAKSTGGVVTADQAKEDGFEAKRTTADGRAEVSHDDSITPGQSRVDAEANAQKVARQFTQPGNSDRYSGVDGGTVPTPPGTPSLNAPDVGYPSTGAGNSAAEQLVPADDADSGAPAEGSLYDQPTEDLVGLFGDQVEPGGYVGDGAATVAGGAEAGDGIDGDGSGDTQPEVSADTDANGKPLDDLTKAELTEIGVSEGVLAKGDLDGKGKAKATNAQLVKDIKAQRAEDAKGGAVTSGQVPAAQA